METQNECWSFKNYKHNTEVKAQSDHKYIYCKANNITALMLLFNCIQKSLGKHYILKK